MSFAPPALRTRISTTESRGGGEGARPIGRHCVHGRRVYRSADFLRSPGGMNRIRLIASALALLATGAAPTPAHAQTPSAVLAAARRARVDSLLARMTLEEKVGQMTQLTLSAFTAQGTPHRDSVRLDPEKLREG